MGETAHGRNEILEPMAEPSVQIVSQKLAFLGLRQQPPAAEHFLLRFLAGELVQHGATLAR